MTIATIHILDEVNIVVKGLTQGDYAALSDIFAVYSKGGIELLKIKQMILENESR